MTYRTATGRRGVTTALTALTATTVIGAIAVISPADASGTRPTHGDPAAAKDWLLTQIDPGSGGIPGFVGADWGLTIDALWAVKANGGSTAQTQKIWSAVAKHAKDYAGPVTYGDIDYITAGASAKVLFAAATMGADPTALKQADGSTLNILDQTTKLVATSGPGKGRLKDPEATGYDSTNIFSQSLAVLGFIGSGVHKANPGLVQSTVDFLVRQECSAGWFPMFYPDDKTCDQQNAAGEVAPDNDGTAMALQALLAAKKAGLNVPSGATERASSFLVSVQKPDGSFGGGVSTEGANTNSTGLVAASLYAAGQTDAAARAGRWVAGLQWTGSGSALDSDRGVIAYDATSFAEAKTGGIGPGIDQWRRATAQAIFALHPVPFNELVGSVDAPTTPPTTTSTPTTSTTAPSTSAPTSPEPSTTQPSTSAPSTSAPTTSAPSTSTRGTSQPTTTEPPSATSEPTTSPEPSSTTPSTPSASATTSSGSGSAAPSSTAVRPGTTASSTTATPVQPPRRPTGSAPAIRVAVPDVRTVISRALQHSGAQPSATGPGGVDPFATQPAQPGQQGSATTNSPAPSSSSTSSASSSAAAASSPARATPERSTQAAAAPAQSADGGGGGTNWWPLALAVGGGAIGGLLLLVGLSRRGQL